MAPPMTPATFLTALKDEGVRVVEVGSWRTHNRNSKGAWGPVNGVMIHHTVTSGSARTVEICRNGYSGLPGPLCHGVITKDGRVHLVGYGRANHAGLGDDDVLAAVIAEKKLPKANEANTDGNARYYGFEAENLGDGKDPWPAAQLDAIERVSAAICRVHGWDAASVIGHLEWQPGKVDPRGFTMASMRDRIERRLSAPPGKTPTPSTPEKELPVNAKELHEAVWTRDAIPAPTTASTHKTNPTWKAESYFPEIYNQTNRILDVVKSLAKEVAALRAEVAQLKKGA
ncbi:N-acetylmuramoyl-L-alanine amidase [Streptomyces sp. Iso 434]|uniref:N-acetylmuramoyl-L-alanine amidase n=1 Tax=Streptomyces sp. Iso 434 TaxID=3062272 RepID=UPI0039808DA4